MSRPEIYQSPQPSQLFKLSAIAVCLAKDQDKLRESKKFDNARMFVPEQVEEISFDADRVTGTTHMFAGFVARQGYGRDRTWRMWLIEKFWTDDDGQTGAARTTYHFEWNNDEVLKCHRIILAPGEEEVVYDADLIVPDESDFDPDWINAKYEMTTVSEADCLMLLKDLRRFSQISQPISEAALHYNR